MKDLLVILGGLHPFARRLGTMWTRQGGTVAVIPCDKQAFCVESPFAARIATAADLSEMLDIQLASVPIVDFRDLERTGKDDNSELFTDAFDRILKESRERHKHIQVLNSHRPNSQSFDGLTVRTGDCFSWDAPALPRALRRMSRGLGYDYANADFTHLSFPDDVAQKLFDLCREATNLGIPDSHLYHQVDPADLNAELMALHRTGLEGVASTDDSDWRTGLRNLFMDMPEPGCFILQRSQWLPLGLDELWTFFGDETNLEHLTPEWLNFHVLGKDTTEIQAGTRIRYKLKIRGIPQKWTTKIHRWDDGKGFEDHQEHGPYRIWHHAHSFEQMAGGTLVSDRVVYKLPFGLLGAWTAGFFVHKDVESIFNYRAKSVWKAFDLSEGSQ